MANKEISRRDFLKGMAAGAVGVAAAGVLGAAPFEAHAEEAGIYTPGTYSAAARGINTSANTATIRGISPGLTSL